MTFRASPRAGLADEIDTLNTNFSTALSNEVQSRRARVPFGVGFTDVIAHGVSLTLGLNARGNFGFVDRIAASLGIPLLNRALGGSVACWHDAGGANGGWSRVAQDVGSHGRTRTTIAAGSNGVALATAGTVNVASTAGFAPSGYALVNTTLGRYVVAYFGITATNLLNCSGGGGNMATGGQVSFLYDALKAPANVTSTPLAYQSVRPFRPWANGRNPLVIVDLGYADLYTDNEGGADGRSAFTKLASALRFILSRHCTGMIIEDELCTFRNAADSGAGNWTSSGAMTDKNSGQRYAGTTGNLDFARYQLDTTFHRLSPGSAVAAWGPALAGVSGVVNLYADGVLVGSQDISTVRPATAGKYGVWCVRVPVGRSAVHALGAIAGYSAPLLKLEVVNPAGGFVNFDGFQIEGPRPPVVLVQGFPKPYSAGLSFGASVDARDTVIDELNVLISGVVDEFLRTGYARGPRFVDRDTPLAKNPAYFSDTIGQGGVPDGLHWNDDGHDVVAKVNLTEVAKALDDRRSIGYLS